MGGRDATMVLLDENGIRCDGRKIDEPRKIMIRVGGLKNADGSAYIEFGDNKILVGVLDHAMFIQNTCQILIQEFYELDIIWNHSLLMKEKDQLPQEEKLKFPK